MTWVMLIVALNIATASDGALRWESVVAGASQSYPTEQACRDASTWAVAHEAMPAKHEMALVCLPAIIVKE